MFRKLSILILMSSSLIVAEPIQTLDSDFFADEGGPNTGLGVQVIDPDFFQKNRSGRLESAPEGHYGCQAVWSDSPSAESSKIGAIAQSYCAGTPSILWVPRPTSVRRLPPQPRGYYQVCCIRRSEGRRRPRMR